MTHAPQEVIEHGRIGLAVLGSGMIVHDFLTISGELSADLSLAAIFGLETQRTELDELSTAHGIASVYTDYEACLADPAVDAVYVGLPNHLHHRFAADALRAGKHVICEKPFTLDLDELRDLRALATASEVVLIEAITNQYLTNYQLIKAALPRLGNLKLIQCNYSQYSSRYPALQSGEVLPAFDPAMGGGALMDINIYNIHFVVGLLGGPGEVRYLANVHRGVDTSGVLLLDYPGCKVVCVGAKDSAGPVQTLIQGDTGTIVMDGPPNVCEGFTITPIVDRHEVAATEHVDRKAHPHRMVEEFRAFAAMIRTRDLSERDRRLDHSETVLAVASEALASAGIRLGSAAVGIR